MGRLSGVFAAPVTEPTALPSLSSATTVAWAVEDAPADLTVTATEPVFRLGVLTTVSMAAVGTGSIQTVCQMPDVAV